MKATKFFNLISTIIFISNFSFAQNSPGYARGGVLKVKFKKETTKHFDNLLSKSASKGMILADQKAGFVKTGISEIDQLNKKHGIVKFTRVFRDAGKYEKKHREHGLHLWYKLEFSNKKSPNDIVNEFKKLSIVQHAHPQFEVVLHNEEKKKIKGSYRSSK